MLTFNDLKPIVLSIAILIGWLAHCDRANAGQSQVLTLAGGCFWCVEADFESVKGVQSAVSGYTGGSVKNPTYKQVSHGGTGHFEAVQIRFDPDMVSRETLLDLFFRSVDPTDAGGQFCDRGDSYRTAIFVSDPAEKAQAEAAKIRAEAALGQKIVTPILAEARFYPAEGYHQDYYKSEKTVLTRFGPIKQWKAYKRYRDSCGRDIRVQQLWGDAAAFAGG
ncbi:Peptide methionine sulfoxide reductase MsrA 2 [Thalassovita gelatinovora]|uniref:Peptide methionine sulfoxide reductase MsrA n=1 Tax=Thalassovita gelatinovora TaxID=53501 RepID=A0A0P1FWC8_THAGE|nr:peptide-methionine (S)-S-oxide reductase MsrA [Thalassovita gelatinovora]QIZ81067.1 peptide-methionine (S)-S-oxide reductase MsrA [Thalassovita gelatinovora]CUH64959.1 Peptide methionine sulfoxide reductase MsrA 2 [Thalassovita gelatinovora]SEP88832.1 peptide-methionine (S)-S-oxide reductase [Thalassovita gelatinovora]